MNTYTWIADRDICYNIKLSFFVYLWIEIVSFHQLSHIFQGEFKVTERDITMKEVTKALKKKRVGILAYRQILKCANKILK